MAAAPVSNPDDRSVDQVAPQAERQCRHRQREELLPSWREQVGEHQAGPDREYRVADGERKDAPRAPRSGTQSRGEDEERSGDPAAVANVPPHVSDGEVRPGARRPAADRAEEVAPEVKPVYG